MRAEEEGRYGSGTIEAGLRGDVYRKGVNVNYKSECNLRNDCVLE